MNIRSLIAGVLVALASVLPATANSDQSPGPLEAVAASANLNNLLLSIPFQGPTSVFPVPATKLTVATTATIGVIPFGVNARGQTLGFQLQAGLMASPVASTGWQTFMSCANNFSGDVSAFVGLLDSYVTVPADRLNGLPDDPILRTIEMKARDATATLATAAAFMLLKQRITTEVANCVAASDARASRQTAANPQSPQAPTQVPFLSIGLRSVACVIGSSDCPAVSLKTQTRFEKVGRLYQGSGQLNAMHDWAQVLPTGAIQTFDNISIDATSIMTTVFATGDILDALNAEITKLRALSNASTEQLLSPFVSTLVGLSPVDVLHVADVFASPMEAYNSTISTVNQIANVSDEIARVRITECARFEANRTFQQASTCSGYTIPTDSALIDCLRGQLCLPAINTNTAINAQIALLSQRMDLSALSSAVDVPRILSQQLTFPQFEAAGLACVTNHNTDQVAMATCLVKAQLPPGQTQTLAVLDCAQQFRDGIASCMTTALTNDTQMQGMAQCMMDDSLTDTQRLACAAMEAPGADATTIRDVRCVLDASGANDLTDCVSAASPVAKTVFQASTCLTGQQEALSEGLCLASTLGAHLDPQTEAAVQCLQDNSGDYQAAIGCYAANKIGGTAGVILKCAASSGGDYLATAVCAAGPKLNAEQQIALTCAVTAETGPGYAVCVAGRLAMKEFTQCQKSTFAEGTCFGSNNTFRVWSRALLGTDIGANSFVAQNINVDLNAARATISLAEGMVKMYGQALRNTANDLSNVGKDISDVGNAIQSLGQAASNGLQKTLQDPAPDITVRPNGIGVSVGGSGGASVTVGSGGVGVSVGGVHVSVRW